MKQEKFLTIYAVLDEETQGILTNLQNQIIKNYPNGKQTMGIPFHISLGSFPIECEQELIERMKEAVSIESFSIEVDGISSFNQQVIFAKPIRNEKLVELHNMFNGNYADGFSWVPHITLYMGTEEEGQEILNCLPDFHLVPKIVGLELGEFFPTRIIFNTKLR